jgi:hypothetical protein
MTVRIVLQTVSEPESIAAHVLYLGSVVVKSGVEVP